MKSIPLTSSRSVHLLLVCPDKSGVLQTLRRSGCILLFCSSPFEDFRRPFPGCIERLDFFYFLLVSVLCRLPALLPLGFIAEWSITLRLKLLVFSSSAPVRHIMLPELQELLPLEAPRVKTAWYIDCPKRGWNQSLGPKRLSDVGKSLWSQSLHNRLAVGSDLEHVAQTSGLNFMQFCCVIFIYLFSEFCDE